jgi:AcrR family transcriptional regulator
MDEIAAAASVSKQTVYKQFADKQSLFREIVATTVEEVSDPVSQQTARTDRRWLARDPPMPGIIYQVAWIGR